ncbi:protein lifeguard 1-like [Corticium candelabrum]|uniref:protein lifeguard 1-like n=1 Tax=Corticium candelabrum TaxID=121492 RepID=UPI002E263D61|nr:protein lifeguard 1-like [Corticium candelabrum]
MKEFDEPGYHGVDRHGRDFTERAIRMAFIRKVYAILFVQILITIAIICFVTFVTPVKTYVNDHVWVFWTAFGLTIFFIILLACFVEIRRRLPWNYIFLIAFTILESFVLGYISSFYSWQSVLMAMGICAVVCLALTVFSFQTKFDFTTCGGMLFVSLIIFVVFGIFAGIFVVYVGNILYLVYAGIGAMLFSLYLVFDTQLMIGGKHKYALSPEEYIFAALNLYLDIVLLFLYILALLGGGGGNN